MVAINNGQRLSDQSEWRLDSALPSHILVALANLYGIALHGNQTSFTPPHGTEVWSSDVRKPTTLGVDEVAYTLYVGINSDGRLSFIAYNPDPTGVHQDSLQCHPFVCPPLPYDVSARLAYDFLDMRDRDPRFLEMIAKSEIMAPLQGLASILSIQGSDPRIRASLPEAAQRRLNAAQCVAPTVIPFGHYI